MKPTLTMLIGLAGSGKSTYAKKLAEETNAIILSSDALREELFGSADDQNHNTEVFAELHKRCKDELLKLNNIIDDATNINQKKRIAFLKDLHGVDCYKKAIIMATPYELCVENNLKRDRRVPENVIKRMRESFHFPLYNEGFDGIEFVWSIGNMSFDLTKLLSTTYDFDQKNSHHTLTLGAHMQEAFNYAFFKKYTSNQPLAMAVRLHDIGKPDTQTFVDKKGNASNNAHYYDHNFVGAYNAMFYLKQSRYEPYTDGDILHICTLIQYHMHPYLGWKDSEKAQKRDKLLLGEEWFNEVLLLHEADVAAH